MGIIVSADKSARMALGDVFTDEAVGGGGGAGSRRRG